jgi:hypothetical protein
VGRLIRAKVCAAPVAFFLEIAPVTARPSSGESARLVHVYIEFSVVPNAVSDDDLIGMLDSRFWLARSGSVALGVPGTLRKALCQAHTLSTLGPNSIIKMSNEEVRVGSDQIGRVWNRICLR